MKTFPIRKFKSWLEKQDPNRQFDYFNLHNCLIATFLKDSGIKFQSVGGTRISMGNDSYVKLPVKVARSVSSNDCTPSLVLANLKKSLAEL